MPIKARSIGAAQCLACPRDDVRGISQSVQIVKGPDRNLRNKAISQVSAEAGRMICTEANVFIQVETIHAVPIDPRFARQGGQGFELAGSGGNDEAGSRLRFQSTSKNFCREQACILTQLARVLCNSNVQGRLRLGGSRKPSNLPDFPDPATRPIHEPSRSVPGGGPMLMETQDWGEASWGESVPCSAPL